MKTDCSPAYRKGLCRKLKEAHTVRLCVVSLEQVTDSIAKLHPIPSLYFILRTEEHKVQTLLSTSLKMAKNTIVYLSPTVNDYALDMFMLIHMRPLYTLSRTQSRENRQQPRHIFWAAYSVLVRANMGKSMKKLNCM